MCWAPIPNTKPCHLGKDISGHGECDKLDCHAAWTVLTLVKAMRFGLSHPDRDTKALAQGPRHHIKRQHDETITRAGWEKSSGKQRLTPTVFPLGDGLQHRVQAGMVATRLLSIFHTFWSSRWIDPFLGQSKA